MPHSKKKPKKPAKKPAKKSKKMPAKPDLIVYERFPQLTRPTFVQKDRFTGLDIPIFI